MKNLSAFLLLFLSATLALGQAANYTYDNMGNRLTRSNSGGTTPPAADGCYVFALASNTTKKLTNVAGVVKVKDGNGSNAQIWKVESVGTLVRIVADNGSVLGVAGGGNADGNLITLQPSGSEDYKLWTRTNLGSNEVFVRKNSSLIFGSAINYGSGSPDDAVTDIKLANDGSYTYGWNKWVLSSATCPNTSPPPTCYNFALASNTAKKLTNVAGVVKVKDANGSASQIWKVEGVGAHVRITADNGSVLGVAGGGNADGNLVTLQPSGTEDHKLWTRTNLGSNEVFVRKSSSLIFGSAINYGNGSPDDAVTDIKLANDPNNTYGWNKWVLTPATCPATAPPPTCYTFTLASNPAKRLTNVANVVKVKDINGSSSQIWKMESVGAQVRISAGNSSSVLAVQSGGNAVDNLITLQPSGTEDHKLWTRTNLGSNEVFVRNNSSLMFGSPINWGNGDPSDAVTDIKLASDPTYTYGSNKWILATATCPTARTGAEEIVATAPQQTNLETLESAPELTVFPNPSVGLFEARFSLTPNRQATLSLTDMSGRAVWQKAIVGEGDHREHITIPEAAAGVYLLVLRRDGSGPLRAVETKRVLIVK